MKNKAVVIYDKVQPSPLHEESMLQIVSGPEEGTTFELVGSEVKLGRHSDNDIILKDLKASRFHAIIEKKHGHFIVRDLGSQNGIYINNQRVVESQLSNGDFLSVGQVVLKYSEKVKSREASTPSLILSEEKKKNLKPYLWGGILLVLGALIASLYFNKDVPTEVVTRSPSQKSEQPLFGEEWKTGEREVSIPLSSEQSAVQLFFKGEREFLSGNYERAIDYLKACLGLNPTHSLAQLYMQKSYSKLDEEVQKSWELGNLYLSTLEYDLALKEFNRIVEILDFNPDSKLFKDYYHVSKQNSQQLKEAHALSY